MDWFLKIFNLNYSEFSNKDKMGEFVNSFAIVLLFVNIFSLFRYSKSMIPLINSLEALSGAKDSQYLCVVSNKVWLWFHKGRNIRIARVLINLCQNWMKLKHFHFKSYN